jgi:hypothetical protein
MLQRVSQVNDMDTIEHPAGGSNATTINAIHINNNDLIMICIILMQSTLYQLLR